MNPFLEPTVATPQPAEGRRWRSRHNVRPESAQKPPAEAPGTVPQFPDKPTRTVGEPRLMPALGARGMLRPALILCVAVLASALLMPGAAYAIDVNAATSDQLQEIKGIGPKMARTIIEERNRGGRFESVVDLSERVKGIGPKKAAAMQASGLSVGGGDVAKSAPIASANKSAGIQNAKRR